MSTFNSRRNEFHLRIAFGDCDPARIVFYPNYLKWFDTASREFFTHCGIPGWTQTEATLGIIGTPLVDVQVSFRNTATYGEDIRIESWIESWGNKSLVMRHAAYRDDTLLCEGREIRVFAKRLSEDSTKIEAVVAPAAFRRACEQP